MTAPPREIRTVPKNNLEEVRVRLVRPTAGIVLVDLRIFSLSRLKTGSPYPSKAGFCLALDRVPALIEALQVAQREALP